MRQLVNHFERGFGHASWSSEDECWIVFFFDNYNLRCKFTEGVPDWILTFCSEENEHGKATIL